MELLYIIIYIYLFIHKLFACRSILSRYGLWDQLRVDKGKEWYLMLAVQEQLACLRVNQSRPSYLQTTSTMVHMYMCYSYIPLLYSAISPSLKTGYLMSVITYILQLGCWGEPE